MLPEFPKFKTLEAGDGDIIRSCVAKSGRGACEFSFANLMVWRDFDRPSFTFIDDCLCIRIEPVDEPPFFLPPLGGKSVERAVAECVKHTGKISRASPDFVKQFGNGSFEVKELRDHFDYIYRADEMASLFGRKFDGKRNRISAFRRKYPRYEFVKLGKEHATDALSLLNEWCSAKRRADKSSSDLEYTCQRDAIERTFEYFDELKLSGGVIIADDRFLGFVVGSGSNERLACIHFCYGHPKEQGIFQTLLNEACRNTFSKYEFVNLEQDLGIPGLRKIKNSYYPLRMEEKFEMRLTGKNHVSSRMKLAPDT